MRYTPRGMKCDVFGRSQVTRSVSEGAMHALAHASGYLRNDPRAVKRNDA
jgi:hypothetical protein